jgi:tetratricopeptide (TPR) repeat protein
VKIFVSYTSIDREWAHWIGWQLKEAGHEPFVHDWEIGAGENIAGWMEDRFERADRLIGVFSDAYCDATFSQSERWAAYWKDPRGRSGFLVPIEVRAVSKWPSFVSALKRLSLVDRDETEATGELREFLQPPHQPIEKPAFPGVKITVSKSTTSFSAGSEPLGANPPQFPASSPRPPDAIAIQCIDDHEPRPQIFGREDERETVVASILDGVPVLVAGGPGMGKTALATAALYDPRVVDRFGRRRVFASIEAATEPRTILAKLVETIGLAPSGDEASLLRIIEGNAAESPIAAIIDNAETVFDLNYGESQRLLNLVAQVKGLSLVVTIRGIPPPLPGAVHIDDLAKLMPSAARDAFLAIAGASFTNDPDLSRLLEGLDGHALSIHLISAQAIGLPALRGLRESWDEAHAKILRASAEKESRLTSVRASLALSLKTRRLKSTPLARRTLALLAFLPGGLLEDHVQPLLGERGTVSKAKANEAIGCLHQLRLVERRPDRRLRMLTPLRECVKIDVRGLGPDQKRLVDRYLDLAAKAYSIGSKDWEKSREIVEQEADNFDAVCELAVESGVGEKHLEEALNGLKEFHLFSGRAGIRSLDRAVQRFRLKAPSSVLASCLLGLGGVANARSDYDAAGKYFRQSLAVYRRLGDQQGQANCLQSLGIVAQARSDYESARTYFEEALALYRRIGALQGQANCIQGLGTIARARSDHDMARMHFEEALTINRTIGELHGEANCIQSLGMVARARFDYGMARNRLQEALALYRRIGAIHGEANCILSLGSIARGLFDYDTARIHYEDALALYRRIGEMQGQANCTYSLGSLALAHYDYTAASTRFEEAQSFYRRTGDVHGQANCIHSFGLVAFARSDLVRAHALFEQAVPFYQKAEDLLGQASCIHSFGSLARARLDYEKAHEHFQEALALYRRIGELDGEANCILGMGSIARARPDYAAACTRFEEALPLYRRIADAMGEANCLQGLADVACARRDYPAARTLFERALVLYQRIRALAGQAEVMVRLGQVRRASDDLAKGLAEIDAGFDLYFEIADPSDKALPGWHAIHLALTSRDASEARANRDLAKSAWRALGRLDLVQDWVDPTGEYFNTGNAPP